MTRLEKIGIVKALARGDAKALTRNIVWMQHPGYEWDRLSEKEVASVFKEYDNMNWNQLSNMEKVEKNLTGAEIVFLDKIMMTIPRWNARLNEIKKM